MDIAVVIPLFNGEDWIRETLNAVQEQVLSPSELVVVDDGSTDSSRSIVEEYSGVRLLRSPGNGPNAARNFGFRKTGAEAIAFLDHDDLWHPEHLKQLSKLLRGNPNSPAAFASKTKIQGDETPQYSVEIPEAKRRDPWENFPKNALGEPFLALIRRRALKSVDGWPAQHNMSGDNLLWLKLALEGPLVVSDCITAARRIHENSHSSRLRKEDIVKHYARRIEVSEDALAFRRERGHDIGRYRPRQEAQEALLYLLEGFVEGTLRQQQQAVRHFDRIMSDQSQEAILSVWERFVWCTRPYVQQVGVHHHASKILDLVDEWPNSGSRFREILRQWAFDHSPLEQLLERYPWSTSCWRYVLGRGYRRVRQRITLR